MFYQSTVMLYITVFLYIYIFLCFAQDADHAAELKLRTHRKDAHGVFKTE